MKKLSIKEMMSGEKSKYSLVMAVAKRARDIAQKAQDDKVILNEKPVKMAIRDFEEGKYEIFEPDEFDIVNNEDDDKKINFEDFVERYNMAETDGSIFFEQNLNQEQKNEYTESNKNL